MEMRVAPATPRQGVLRSKLRRVIERARESGVDLSRSFRLLDKNGDGKLTIFELTEVLAELGLDDADLKDAEELVRTLDVDGNGTVCYGEFLGIMDDKESSISQSSDTSGRRDSGTGAVQRRKRKASTNTRRSSSVLHDTHWEAKVLRAAADRVQRQSKGQRYWSIVSIKDQHGD